MNSPVWWHFREVPSSVLPVSLILYLHLSPSHLKNKGRTRHIIPVNYKHITLLLSTAIAIDRLLVNEDKAYNLQEPSEFCQTTWTTGPWAKLDIWVTIVWLLQWISMCIIMTMIMKSLRYSFSSGISYRDCTVDYYVFSLIV